MDLDVRLVVHRLVDLQLTEPVFRAANILIDSDKVDAADRILAEAQERFPLHYGLWIQRAWLAHGRRDFAAALDRWAEMQVAFADHPAAYSGAATTLRELGRTEDAEALVAAAMARLPDDPGIAAEHARTALARRDWNEAVARWEQMAVRFPDRTEPHLGVAFVLREQGRFAETDARLREAIKRFPEDVGPLIDAQLPSGAWPRAGFYHMGRRRIDSQPTPPWWGSEALTTVFAVEALTRRLLVDESDAIRRTA